MRIPFSTAAMNAIKSDLIEKLKEGDGSFFMTNTIEGVTYHIDGFSIQEGYWEGRNYATYEEGEYVVDFYDAQIEEAYIEDEDDEMDEWFKEFVTKIYDDNFYKIKREIMSHG
ncbi:MAG: hypothetical protein HUK08_08410 [Bacteroidaceae bacterium]|nr:hypothetical protein [Bacteroidaceae bacterium]